MRASPSASLVHRKSLGKGKATHEHDVEPEAGGDGRRRVQVACARCRNRKIKIAFLHQMPQESGQGRVHLYACIFENAAARARKQAKAAVYPHTSPIKLRRSWDEAIAREEAAYSRRARSLSSGHSNPSTSAFAPLDAPSVHSPTFPAGLTREVNNFHISDGRYTYDTAPSYPSSASNYSNSSTTSPVEPHFPQLPPSSWAPSGVASYVSASYQTASLVAPIAHPPHLPRPTASGLPLPLYPPPEAHRYQAWDIPTPPSETPSPRTSEPDSHAYSAYAPVSSRPPIAARRQRPRLQHSLSLPMPATDAPLPYSTLIDGQVHAYQPPPKYEVPYYPHTTHASSVALERQATVENYFQTQPVHRQAYPSRPYDQRYHQNDQHHPRYPPEQRQYQDFTPEVTFSRVPSHEDPMLTPVVSRPLSPDASSSLGGDASRRSSAGGSGAYEEGEQFGFQLPPQGW
ncbi:hypothetical protein BCR35DRAFT_352527 [Leucosporidium creatinivorum]|uniref:Uncharacterized protein n=1 Tax=Leucosporidium creatinivorum TaxID=106004 RepID=A0A1Y2FBF5_9BASI|nr:hypothetical protein BCR35DRAFT_352527 [Leucosporidium creatinivorum]